MLYLTFVLYLTSAEQDPHGVESAYSKIYYLVKVSFNSDSRTEKLTKMKYRELSGSKPGRAIKLDGVSPVIADPSRCNCTNRQNPTV